MSLFLFLDIIQVKNMDGVLNVNKPKGMTSHDVVDWVRSLVHMKRVGHTGTLDPEARGVLPICIGKATKIVQFLTGMQKSYIATMRLGIVTDTQDATGRVIRRSDQTDIPKGQIESAFEKFRGKIQQIPPMASAVRIGGKRLYELARKEAQIQRPTRSAQIYRLEVLDYRGPDITFEVTSSKGTYIRTLCADIGEVLGCGAHMASLIRTKSGPFLLEDSHTLEELKDVPDIRVLLWSMDEALGHLATVKVKEGVVEAILNGVPINASWIEPWAAGIRAGQFVRVHSPEGELLAVARASHDTEDLAKLKEKFAAFKSVRVFN